MYKRQAYDVLLKNAENKRDGYLKKAEEEVKKAAEAAKKGNIGGQRSGIAPRRSLICSGQMLLHLFPVNGLSRSKIELGRASCRERVYVLV